MRNGAKAYIPWSRMVRSIVVQWSMHYSRHEHPFTVFSHAVF